MRIILNGSTLAGSSAIRLDLANLSTAHCLTGIRLLNDVKESSCKGGWYFSGVLEPLSARSRRRIQYSAEALAREGQPGHWGSVSLMEVILALPKGSSFRGDLVIVLHGMQCLSLASPRGPRLSEAGLQRVASSGQLRDQPPGAGFDALRSREDNPPGFETNPPLPSLLEPPGLLVRGQIMGRQIGFPPDWSASGSGPHQWLHCLHRHHFLRSLAREFAQTRDHRLAEAAACAIKDWIPKHPVPLDSCGGASPAWETLSAAWRIREWLGAMSAMWQSQPFCHQTRSLMLRSLWEHASHLTDHQGHPTNWALLEAAALALAGWRLDCFENAATWAQVGMQRLTREAQRQFLPDGAHFELSPLYQAICLEALLEVRRAVRARGRVFPEILDGTIRRGLDYLLALRRPNGTWPAHNDSWGMDGDHGALFALAEKAQDPSGGHLWDAGGIKDCAPGPAGRHFRQAGVCILGQSPGALKGNRLVFRAGPAGAAHAHDDTLSLDVSLAGQPFVVDPGISDYDAGRLAEHYRGIHAHSLPWMDGWARAASRLTWRERISQAHGDLAYAVEEDLEAATAVAWGPWSRPNPDGLIFRSVVSCGGDYFVVRDHFQGPGVRRLAVHWQFAPGVLELAPNGLVARLHGAAAMVGRLVFLGCAQGLRLERLEGSLEPLGGWVAVAGRDTPAACLTYRLTSVLPRTLVWLLWPGEAEPGTAQVSSGDQTGLVRLGIPLPGGRWDELELGPPSLAAKAPGGLRQGGVRLTRRHAGGESVILRLPG